MDLVIDKKQNVEGDNYEKLDSTLFNQLEVISSALKNQISNHSRRILISDLRKHKMSRKNVRKALRNIANQDYNSYLGGAKKPVNNDYSGIYLFGYSNNGKTTPVYVGISRNIVRRLNKHFWSTSSNSASWMYRIAQKYLDADRSEHRTQIEELQKNLANRIYVTIYPLKEPYKLHIAEAYIASTLKTYWNTFKTH